MAWRATHLSYNLHWISEAPLKPKPAISTTRKAKDTTKLYVLQHIDGFLILEFPAKLREWLYRKTAVVQGDVQQLLPEG